METFYQTTLTYIHSHSNLKKIIIFRQYKNFYPITKKV